MKWVMIGAAVAGVGPGLAYLYDSLVRAGDGGSAATMLVGLSAMGGLLATALVFAAALVFAYVGARLCGERTGYALAGFTLAGPAWAQGSVMDLLRWATAPKAFWMLAVEGAVIAALTIVLATACRRGSHKSDAAHTGPRHGDDPPLSAQGALGFAVALAAGFGVAWLVAREPLPGQTLAAGFFGGIGAATAARVAAVRCPPIIIVAAMGALAVIAPVYVGVTHGTDALRAIYQQKLAGVGLLMPLDWAAGAMLGTPVGIAWAASLTEKRVAKAAGAQSA